MDKMRFESKKLIIENIEKIAAVFPGVVTEGKVNFDLLRSLLGDEVYGDEAYEFTWVGKRAAIAEAGRPIRKTLRPCPEESKNWDITENLYIEGDNLDVLKLLQESYLGKVKMIYIDPPYNTGNDFVYRDNFTRDKGEYEEQVGVYDENGDRLFRNTESNGRFHSDWCSMMYPRLVLARNLLRDDGVIFISIDDNEVAQLRKICDEVFGEINFIACLVYDKNRKNDAKYFSVGHEYMLVYFKSVVAITEMGLILRANKEGIDEVKVEFERLRSVHGDDWEKVNKGLKTLFASWSNDDARKPLARFTKVDEKGPYRDDGNISWPGGGGPKYDVIHPVTGKPCKCPDAGWRYPNPERMQEEIANGRVVFGADEKTLPRVRRNLFESDKQVMRSVTFSYAQTATLDFIKIFDNARVFENPKSVDDIRKLIAYITNSKDEDTILDFFSGSATTAHAVMQLNAEDGGKRKFIMVQLPEPCDEKSEAAKAGFNNICEIGKERIRRAGEKIKEENKEKEGIENLDIGFRVLKLDSTNMKDVYYAAGEYTQDLLALMEDNIKEDRTDMDLLYACLLDWGLPLSLPHKTELLNAKGEILSNSVLPIPTSELFKVHTYNDGDLIACFDKHISEAVVKEIAQRQPLRAVFRDSSFASSPEKINVEEIFKLLAPNTSVKVL